MPPDPESGLPLPPEIADISAISDGAPIGVLQCESDRIEQMFDTYSGMIGFIERRLADSVEN